MNQSHERNSVFGKPKNKTNDKLEICISTYILIKH